MAIISRDFIKHLPLVSAFLKTDTWGAIRHKGILQSDTRDFSITFTRFIRLPTQFEALAGPVIDFILGQNKPTAPLSIAVLGCSTGAEAYSIASILQTRRPEIRFKINASDLSPEVIVKAKAAIYTEREVYSNKMMYEKFVTDTFNREGDLFVVKPEIAQHVSFEVMDALDPAIVDRVGLSDIVFAQNFLFNLPRAKSVEIFENIVKLLKPRAAFFIESMDYDLRARLTRHYGLKPLDFELENIHNDARSERAAGWPYRYWGLEPFSRFRFNMKRRYATIFLRGR